MKTIQSLVLIALVIVASAFTVPTKKQLDVKESNINWTGKKVTGQHTGTINLSKGYLEMEGDILTGGMFVIDMTSITVTDLQAGKGKEKLEGHLKSDDFFGIEAHPTATLVIKKAKAMDSGYAIMGSITVKGVTEDINFDLKMDGTVATTKLKIDRTKFGVRYGSGSFFDNLGDKTIDDLFELDVTLKF